MTTPSFHFKQFTIEQDRCAMKVGTDGILLGAWAQTRAGIDLSSPRRILDIGTGTGLLALMLAQKNQEKGFPFSITALEIDEGAAQQARENIENSPWKKSIKVIQADAKNWQGEPFDHIVCNPPYFVEALKGPNPTRNQARHNETLSWKDLFITTHRLLLKPEATFDLIFPADQLSHIKNMASSFQLAPLRLCAVFTKAQNSPALRMLATFGFSPIETSSILPLYLRTPEGSYHPTYRDLVKDFYLWA